jgi:oligo-1,6-glucosidase
VRNAKEILKVVGAKRGELNMIFIFEMVDIDNDETGFRLTLRDWNTNEIKKIFNKWQALMIDHDGWNSLFIENHGKTLVLYVERNVVLTAGHRQPSLGLPLLQR